MAHNTLALRLETLVYHMATWLQKAIFWWYVEDSAEEGSDLALISLYE